MPDKAPTAPTETLVRVTAQGLTYALLHPWPTRQIKNLPCAEKVVSFLVQDEDGDGPGSVEVLGASDGEGAAIRCVIPLSLAILEYQVEPGPWLEIAAYHQLAAEGAVPIMTTERDKASGEMFSAVDQKATDAAVAVRVKKMIDALPKPPGG